MKRIESILIRSLLVGLGLSCTAVVQCHAGEDLSVAQELTADYRYSAALAPLRRAAESGERDARQMLGFMLLHGETLYGNEVQANRQEAAFWLDLAARDGCEISKNVLAKMDTQGKK